MCGGAGIGRLDLRFRPAVEGGLQEGGKLNSHTPDPKGSVDDGKSWYSEGSCISVIYLNRGGSLREGRARDSP